MAKGTYAVKQDENASPHDASFKTCVCTLLIFFALCVIILLVSVKWTKDEIKKEIKADVELMKVPRDGVNSSKMFEKLQNRPTPSPKEFSPNASTVISPEKLEALQKIHDIINVLKNKNNSIHVVKYTTHSTTALNTAELAKSRNPSTERTSSFIEEWGSTKSFSTERTNSITESIANFTKTWTKANYVPTSLSTERMGNFTETWTHVPLPTRPRKWSTERMRNYTETWKYSSYVPTQTRTTERAINLTEAWTSTTPVSTEKRTTSTESVANLTDTWTKGNYVSTERTPNFTETWTHVAHPTQPSKLSTERIPNFTETWTYSNYVPTQTRTTERESNLTEAWTNTIPVSTEKRNTSTESSANFTETWTKGNFVSTERIRNFTETWTHVPLPTKPRNLSTETISNITKSWDSTYLTSAEIRDLATEKIINFTETVTRNTPIVLLTQTSEKTVATTPKDMEILLTKNKSTPNSSEGEVSQISAVEIPTKIADIPVSTATEVADKSATEKTSTTVHENERNVTRGLDLLQNVTIANLPIDPTSITHDDNARSTQGDNINTSMKFDQDSTDNASAKIDDVKKLSTSTWVTTEDSLVPMSSIINDTDVDAINKTEENLQNVTTAIRTTPNHLTTPKQFIDQNGQQQMIDFNKFPFEDVDDATSSILKLGSHTTTTKPQLVLEKQNSTKPEEPVCETVECKSAASRMLSLINYSVDPCEDFYEFSCGGMQAGNYQDDTWKTISEQVNSIDGKASRYLKTFKTFHRTCVKHEDEFDYDKRVVEVLKLVKQVGKIFTDEAPEEEQIDLTSLFANLILRQSLPIIDVGVNIDEQSSIFILKLVLPEKTPLLSESGRWSALSDSQTRCLSIERHELQKRELNLTKIHSSYLECQKNHSIYLNSVQAVAQTLGFYSHLEHQYNKSQQIEELRMSIEWDILDYLDEIPPPNVARKMLLFKNYVTYTISDLQQKFGVLDWNKFFQILTKHEMDNDTFVQVYYPDYFTRIFQGLRKASTRKINNALIAMYAHNLYEHLVLPQAKNFRDDYCIQLSSKLFHDVTNNLYVKTWPSQNKGRAKKFATAVFDNLKGQMEQALQKVDWLDDDSRLSSLRKVKRMTLIFNEPQDLYNNDTYLEMKYSAVTLNDSNWYENVITMIMTSKQKLMSLEGQVASTKDLWSNFLSAYDEAPTSFYSKYYIMVPLGMLKPSIATQPGYISMAQIGFHLAKQIGRHFDSVGVKHGMTLSPSSKAGYDRMVATMEDESLLQATKLYRNLKISFKADAELSTNERIADNTALKLITDSFNSIGDDSLLPWISTSFSRRKIFFITVAQEYCKQTSMAEYTQQLFESEILPAPLRVENVVTNSQDFASSFECPVGSAMNNNPGSVQFPYLEKVELL